jgi:spore germination cell wall hydrolase CwlJ-like protein
MISAALACLALNVYFEARDQSIAGQVAIAQVTLNRVASSKFPDEVCAVVYQRGQFSWYWDGKSDTPYNTRAWEQAVHIADAVMSGSVHSDLIGVTHYHAVYVKPYWAETMIRVVQIGDHVFYKDQS